jgi:UDPglucose 6-dehydrogenase
MLMQVAVVGAGYVGLVTAAGLAELGHAVTCIDVDERKVAALNRGEPPIFEQGLQPLLRRNLGTRLAATTDLAATVRASELTLICVGTPSRPDGSIDLSFVRQAAEQIGSALATRPEFHAVVVKSTVVPGTSDEVVRPACEVFSGKMAGLDFGVGVNPEFLTEGQAVDDFLHPDRIVIGGDGRTVAALRQLYAGFDGVPIVETNASTAEMIKYASNAMLAAAISFANEIANLGSTLGGVDAVEVMRGVHLSRYLTTRLDDGTSVTAPLAAFYEAGCGYGGSCLPKDVAALAARGRGSGSPMPLLEAVARINDRQPGQLVDLLRRELGTLQRRRITVLGLAFKPDTDDVRCSPAFGAIRLLIEAGAEVTVHDPVVGAELLHGVGEVAYVGDLADAVKNADAIVIITRWDDYLRIPELIARLDPPPLVVDGRRMLEKMSVPRYTGIGL